MPTRLARCGSCGRGTLRVRLNWKNKSSPVAAVLETFRVQKMENVPDLYEKTGSFDGHGLLDAMVSPKLLAFGLRSFCDRFNTLCPTALTAAPRTNVRP